VRVHRNLHRRCWSLTPKGGRVTHAEAVTLAAVRFVVSAAGRARVLAKRVRAVHAWAEGAEAEEPADLAPLIPVTYNPYRAACFTRCDTGEPVTRAALVVFTAAGQALAHEPTA
jgi:hypothetical protein